MSVELISTAYIKKRSSDSSVGVQCQVALTSHTIFWVPEWIDALSVNNISKLRFSLSLFCCVGAQQLKRHQNRCQMSGTQVYITVPWVDTEGLSSTWLYVRLSRFTLNLSTLLTVTINIPLGVPVTESQLAWVALTEPAAWNCRWPSLSPLPFSLHTVIHIFIELNIELQVFQEWLSDA